tara:strand:+ start:122 stop:250 length:129 start_codon:yes stop_codon:yes gene_type:complete
MFTLCNQPIIKKTRYRHGFKDLTWKIDEFHGVNEGLIVAKWN